MLSSVRALRGAKPTRLIERAPTRLSVGGGALALEHHRFARVDAQAAGGHAWRRPELALRVGDRDWVTDAAAEQETDQCDRQEGHSHRPVSGEPRVTTAARMALIGR